MVKKINLYDEKYVDNIADDLLNPTFSSFIARDVLAPAQHFYVGPYRYIKDRAYSFEEKLNDNTDGILDKRLKDYVHDEANASIPLMIYHSMVNRDARKIQKETWRSFLRQLTSAGYMGPASKKRKQNL